MATALFLPVTKPSGAGRGAAAAPQGYNISHGCRLPIFYLPQLWHAVLKTRVLVLHAVFCYHQMLSFPLLDSVLVKKAEMIYVYVLCR